MEPISESEAESESDSVYTPFELGSFLSGVNFSKFEIKCLRTQFILSVELQENGLNAFNSGFNDWCWNILKAEIPRPPAPPHVIRFLMFTMFG